MKGNDLDYAAATDVGRKRQHNEDTFLSAPELGLWLVADGMGGHEHGEVASAMARDTINTEIKAGRSLVEAIARANQLIYERPEGGQSAGPIGMGTTIVAVRTDGADYTITWVGDSRAYLYSGGIKLLTRDHSFVQDLVDDGTITPEQATTHPHRNVITQALGVTPPSELRADSVKGKFNDGDWLLLCSDGLNTELSDDNIAKILAHARSADKAVDKLIAAANRAGGADNITCVVLGTPR